MSARPSPFRWDAARRAMVALARGDILDKYQDGKVYVLTPVEERSLKSERQYFAALDWVFGTLGEHLDETFDTREQMRKHALISCGYSTHRNIVCDTQSDALRFSRWIRSAVASRGTAVRAAALTDLSAMTAC
jgi:hypothetical protein